MSVYTFEEFPIFRWLMLLFFTVSSQVHQAVIFWKLFLFWSSDEGKPVFNGLIS